MIKSVRLPIAVKLAPALLILGLAGSLSPSFADDTSVDPKKWCAEASDLLAAQRVEEIPARAVAASRGEISAESAKGFLAVKPVTDVGNVRANSFLVEKNYNDAISKVWHLIVFGTDALYVRCTFYKMDGSWMLWDLSFNTDEGRIGLP